MLFANDGTTPRRKLDPGHHRDDEAARRAVWLDLVDGTEAERAMVERATGLRVPSLEEISEIESSSRLSHRNGVVTLSTPMLARSDEAGPVLTPLGFVLSRERLLTVRTENLRAFETFAERFADSEPAEHCSLGAFLGLLEAIVDRIADLLERVGGELDAISRRVFGKDTRAVGQGAQQDADLQAILRAVGRGGDMISNLRDSLLGVSRIAAFVEEISHDWLPPALAPRLHTLRQDVASLSDHDAQLTNKVQFLLDATLGFISIQQNNGIKVLTVVSVVGVPPTLVASIYGMNFKNMPELNWEWGYAWGLGMILLSAVLPLLWFRRRGWI